VSSRSFSLCLFLFISPIISPHHPYLRPELTTPPPEIIPKFTCLLARSKPVVLHGDGSPTRRYLFAGDAADAFDTILHRGQLGQIYNVGSHDEISNLALAKKILAQMGIVGGASCSSSSSSSPSASCPPPLSSKEKEKAGDGVDTGAGAGAGDGDDNGNDATTLTRWIKYTHDRPFNDHRYAVDATKLRALGWRQRTSFDDGLRVTVDWYRRFGERWWGDISKVLTPFPVLAGREVLSDHEPVSDHPPGVTGRGE
jgi:dTDP-glucose 4,6-dehydratase